MAIRRHVSRARLTRSHASRAHSQSASNARQAALEAELEALRAEQSVKDAEARNLRVKLASAKRAAAGPRSYLDPDLDTPFLDADGDDIGAELRALAEGLSEDALRIPPRVPGPGVVKDDETGRRAPREQPQRRARRPVTAGADRPSSGGRRAHARAPQPSMYRLEQEEERRRRTLREQRHVYEPRASVHGVALPPRVTAQPARARRPASATSAPRVPPRPWRCNASVHRDVVEKHEPGPSAPKKHARRSRASPAPPRSGKNYPSFRDWLARQAVNDEEVRERVARKARLERDARRRRLEAEATRAAGRDAGLDAPGSLPPNVAASGPSQAPALANFVAVCEAFGGDPAFGAFTDDPAWREAAERALARSAAAAAAEKANAAAAAEEEAEKKEGPEGGLPPETSDALSDGAEPAAPVAASDGADPTDGAEPAGEAAAATDGAEPSVAETAAAAVRAMKARVARYASEGLSTSLSTSQMAAAAAAAAEKASRPPDDPPPPPLSREQRVAAALASMTPDERVAARARASKGWSGDFSGVFFKTAEARRAFPSWSEKPRVAAVAPSVIYDGGVAAKEAAIDASLARSAADVSALSVQFIGPNAHELAFRALHPDATESDLPPPPHAEKTEKETSALSAQLDPSDPVAVEAAKRDVLDVQFIGANADELAFRALFPDRDPPRGVSSRAAPPPVECATRMDAAPDADEPLEHLTGAAGLEVEFIGPNAAELTFLARQPAGTYDRDAVRDEAKNKDAAATPSGWPAPPPQSTASTLNEHFHDYGMAAPDGVAVLRRLVAESEGLVADVVEDTRVMTAAVGASLRGDEPDALTPPRGGWSSAAARDVETLEKLVETAEMGLDANKGGEGGASWAAAALPEAAAVTALARDAAALLRGSREGRAPAAAENKNPWGPPPDFNAWESSKLDESVEFEEGGAWNFDEIMEAGEKLAETAGGPGAPEVDFKEMASPLLDAVKGRLASAFRS